MQNGLLRLLIADYHSVAREGLKDIIESTREMTVIAEAQSEFELSDRLQSTDVDAVVFEFALAKSRALETLSTLRRRYPHTPLLIFTTWPEHEYGIRALKAGAAGYLSKGSTPTDVIAAIKRVAAGRRYVTPALGELIAVELTDPNGAPHHALTEREYAIFKLYATGQSTGNIARELRISPKTVMTARARVLSKLHATTIADLVHYAVRHNLLNS
jgi:DNA-binding NarL/FixJ family response regulator